MYEFDNSWKLETFLLIDFLPNVSYSGYRNHIQKDTLQEYVKFGHCNWPWHVDLLIGWRNKAAPRARIVSNWSRQPLGGVWKLSLNARTPSWTSSLENALSLKMPSTNSLFSHAFCHHLWTFWAPCGPQASCYHDEKKSHLVSLHPFIFLI